MSYIGNSPTSIAFLTDTFSGNGSTTAFTLSAAPANTSSVLVAVSGVLQDPSTYSSVGTTLNFSAAPPSGTSNISVRFLGIPASGVTTTAYRTTTEFTATASQTTFSVPSYTVGFIDVYRNGVMLGSADYTATNGTTVVLATGATAGDLIEVISFQVSSVLNAIPNSPSSVGTSNLVDGSVTTAKIADDAVDLTTKVTGVLPEANGGTGTTTGYYGFKNRIINGQMTIAQRGTSSVTNDSATNLYPVDRFIIYGNVSSKFTAQQDAGAVTPPVGFNDYLGCTSLSAYSVGSSDLFFIQQRVEGFNMADLGWGTANAQTVTLSFWVRSSLTGTFGGALQNSDSNRSYPFSYTISAANTWELKSVTIAGDTTGTWLTTNGTGIQLYFSLGAGSTRNGTAGAWAGAGYYSATGATSVVGTNGATLYITGVQLEKGSTATSFDYRPYGTELALCQRYYYVVAKGYGFAIANGYYFSSSQVRTVITFPVELRATPSLISNSGSNYYFMETGAGDYFNSFIVYRPDTKTSVIYNAADVSGTAGYAANMTTDNTASLVAFSAEL